MRPRYTKPRASSPPPKNRTIGNARAEIENVQQDRLVEEEILQRSIKQSAISILAGLKNNKKIKNINAEEILDKDKINNLTINESFRHTCPHRFCFRRPGRAKKTQH